MITHQSVKGQLHGCLDLMLASHAHRVHRLGWLVLISRVPDVPFLLFGVLPVSPFRLSDVPAVHGVLVLLLLASCVPFVRVVLVVVTPHPVVTMNKPMLNERKTLPLQHPATAH